MEIGPAYPMWFNIRKISSQRVSPRPVEMKSQPRRGSAHGKCEDNKPLRPLFILILVSLQST